jgi:AcrR family transcriptional regulator
MERSEAQPAPERPRHLLTAMLTGAELRPAAARAMTVEAFAAGPGPLAERERLLTRVEAAIGRYSEDLPSGAARPLIPARALVGGVEGVVAMRVFRGDSARLGGLLFDLLDWLDSYAVPANRRPIDADEWAALGAGLRPAVEGEADRLTDRPLPRGSAALPDAEVAAEHRARVLTAVADLSAAKGYANTTVADVVAAARVTRASFYRQFRGKQDAFLATQTAALQATISRSAEAFFGVDAWPERVWNGLEALLAYAAQNPELAYLDVVDSFAVGPAAIRRSFDNRVAFNIFLEEGYRQSAQAKRLPAVCSEAIGGAILELMRSQILAGRAERVFEILPQAAYVALAPFVGPDQALDFVVRRASSSIPT